MPEAVDHEITHKTPAFLPSWLRSQRASDRGLVDSLLAEIDLAEAEAIALAIELKTDAVRMVSG
jgi:predicted nucleic acid-binding protein